jgi:NAD(P)-dependent dehydrogenase (short-subunit alcohol dehydrogenase family)
MVKKLIWGAGVHHDKETSRKVILITGANRVIGLETARQLARRGCHVVIGVRDEESGRAAVQTVQAEGGPATFLPLDVSQSNSIEAAACAFPRIASHLDVLINNAGIYSEKGLTVLTVSRDQLTQDFQTNTFGPLAVTQGSCLFCGRRWQPGSSMSPAVTAS